jgi:hypothetical protein
VTAAKILLYVLCRVHLALYCENFHFHDLQWRPPVVCIILLYNIKRMKCGTPSKDVRFEVFTAVTMKNGVFWDVTPCVSEELSASFIRVTRIGELGTTLAVTSNRRTLRRNTNTDSCHPDEGGAKFLRNMVLTRATRHNIPEDAILPSKDI